MSLFIGYWFEWCGGKSSHVRCTPRTVIMRRTVVYPGRKFSHPSVHKSFLNDYLLSALRTAGSFTTRVKRQVFRTLKHYLSYDVLQIDELGYTQVEPAQVGLFFTLMQQRHKKKHTLITSNLGFEDWNTFLKNPSLTAALIDRLTENSHVFNLRGCPNPSQACSTPSAVTLSSNAL